MTVVQITNGHRRWEGQVPTEPLPRLDPAEDITITTDDGGGYDIVWRLPLTGIPHQLQARNGKEITPPVLGPAWRIDGHPLHLAAMRERPLLFAAHPAREVLHVSWMAYRTPEGPIRRRALTVWRLDRDFVMDVGQAMTDGVPALGLLREGPEAALACLEEAMGQGRLPVEHRAGGEVEIRIDPACADRARRLLLGVGSDGSGRVAMTRDDEGER